MAPTSPESEKEKGDLDPKNVIPTAGNATPSNEPNRRTPEILHVGLISCGALVLSALSLKFLPMPFVWIGLTWASALIGGLFFLHGTYPRWSPVCLHATWFRALLFSVSVATASLAGVEAYLSLHGGTGLTYSDLLFVKDDELGTSLAKVVRVHATSGTSDVIYTTDSNGFRTAPPVQIDKHPGCILFFGDSFTFGSGLQDNETMPYQVGIQSGEQYRIFNFAVPGYGPHQMLAQIEQGRVSRVVDCRPKYAIYEAITDHVRRATGKVPYGKHSPRYMLDPEGTLRRDGNFVTKERTPSPFEAEVRWELGKSAIYRLLTNRQPRVSEDDIRLTLAIVGRSRDLLAAQYPGIEFHVILWRPWGRDAFIYRELQDGLRQMNIPVHLVENILPGFTLATSSRYAISAIDGHPNALANRILANYVLIKIVSAEPGANASPK